MSIIEIAKQFSSTPGGRFRRMGPDSGEEFRDMLRKALLRKPTDIVEVVLDGAEGYGSSFLEEVFGGLIREKILSPDDAMRRIRVVARNRDYQLYADEAAKYMQDAIKALR